MKIKPYYLETAGYDLIVVKLVRKPEKYPKDNLWCKYSDVLKLQDKIEKLEEFIQKTQMDAG